MALLVGGGAAGSPENTSTIGISGPSVTWAAATSASIVGSGAGGTLTLTSIAANRAGGTPTLTSIAANRAGGTLTLTSVTANRAGGTLTLTSVAANRAGGTLTLTSVAASRASGTLGATAPASKTIAAAVARTGLSGIATTQVSGVGIWRRPKAVLQIEADRSCDQAGDQHCDSHRLPN